jgi:hypothetical protein
MDAAFFSSLQNKDPKTAALELLKKAEEQKAAERAALAEKEAIRLEALAQTVSPSLAPAATTLNSLFGTRLDPGAFDSSVEQLTKPVATTGATRSSGLETIALRSLLEKEDEKSTEKKPTKGEEAKDKNFAEKYNEFISLGGISELQRNLQALDLLEKKLETEKGLTGASVGLLPKIARDVLNPEASVVQEELERIVQGTLKQTLGTAFTAAEGERVINRAYNPVLPQPENLRRVKDLKKYLRRLADAKIKSTKYYEEKGTLTGFKGEVPEDLKENFSIDDGLKSKMTPSQEKVLELLRKGKK